MLNKCKPMTKAEKFAGIDLSNHNRTLKRISEIPIAASISTVEPIERVDHFALHPNFIDMFMVQPCFGHDNAIVAWPLTANGRKKESCPS